MGKRRASRKPRFWWQALLILLPIAVLASVGLVSIRQDKSMALQEANERARAVAEDVLAKVWDRIGATNDLSDFKRRGLIIDGDGTLVYPPKPEEVPLPVPLKVSELNPHQLRLWSDAEASGADSENLELAAQKYRDFIATDPPYRFAWMAHYNLGLVLMKQGLLKQAADVFSVTEGVGPSFLTAAGLPLQTLCQLKLLELQSLQRSSNNDSLVLVDEVCANVIDNPTILTSWILNKLETSASSNPELEKIKVYQQLWEDHECSRRCYEMVVLKTGIESWKTANFRWASVESASESELETGTSKHLLTHEAAEQNWLAIPANASAPIPDLSDSRAPFSSSETIRKLRGSLRVTTHLPLPKNYVSVDFPPTPFDWKVNTNKHWFFWRSESEIGQRLTEIVVAEKQIPPYFGVSLEVAGKVVRRSAPDLRVWRDYHHGGKGGGFEKELTSERATKILATAARPSSATTDTRTIHVDVNPPSVWKDLATPSGDQDFKVVVYLTSPSALFERQQARSFWIETLIAVAAVTSLLGLSLAWRAFYRQQMLTELKTNFVSSVSHELRAPIASVRLLAESLEGGRVQESTKQQEYFRFIGQECRRLSALIENILDFSRIEQDRRQYDFQPTDLLALTRQTVALMETYAAEKDVLVKLELSSRLATESVLELNIDGRAIQQALVNLIDNAIKHSARGQAVRVGLDDKVCTDSNVGSKVILWVEDDGPGIPADEHAKIFERFYRLGSELRRETQGVGIGLSLVKHIVEAHNGEVLVRSGPGEGSRFTIELPITASRTH